jgi:hypothetical protein
VRDFTDRPLSSLNAVERLAFEGQMTRTEFAALRQAQPGGADYDPLIATSPDLAEARRRAQAKLEALKIDNAADYARFWALDYLTDDQLQKWTTCSSRRRPGLVFAGRPTGPGGFNLTFAHLAPIGIEKIRLRLVASHNVANIEAFEQFLDGLGLRDNFLVQTFALRIADPGKPAVLLIRAGWETPNLIYIPAYPAPEVP